MACVVLHLGDDKEESLVIIGNFRNAARKHATSPIADNVLFGAEGACQRRVSQDPSSGLGSTVFCSFKSPMNTAAWWI